jgi:predicted membrane channel-forming protein YqfA (hemolysin III family)
MQVLIANITLTLAVLVKLVNIFADKEVWILLFVAMSILIILAMYTIKERAKIRQRQASNRKTQQK